MGVIQPLKSEDNLWPAVTCLDYHKCWHCHF